MTGIVRRVRARMLTLVVAAVGVVAITGTALAGHQTSGVKSYTGCLVSGDGVIIKIKEGNAPKSACTGGQVEAHFSGGDITKISVGAGLTTVPSPGENGDVRIELAAGQALPQGCDDGEVAEWDTSPDPDRWVCGIDDDTTYSEGTGLDLSSGNAFSIEPAYRVKNTPDCSSGQFATGFDSAGNINCSAPPASQGVQGYSASAGYFPLAGAETIISKTLPAGNYVLFASVAANNRVNSDEVASGYCSIPGQQLVRIYIPEGFNTDNTPLTSAISHSGGAVELVCQETFGNLEIAGASLTAIEVDSLG